MSFGPKVWFRTLSDRLFSPKAVASLFRTAPADPFVWSQCSRILVLKLDEIGDFILSTPFLRGLRRSAPHADISLVVKPDVLNLAETCPHVNRVLTYDGQTKGLSAWQLRRQWRAWQFGRHTRRRGRADVAVLPRWGEDAYNATFVAVFSRPCRIVAYTEQATPAKRAMNQGFDRLVSHVVAGEGAQHEVERNIALLARFGGVADGAALEVWPTDADRQFASGVLTAGQHFVALAPEKLDPRRRWPAERFAAIAAILHDQFHLVPVLLGTTREPAIPGALDLRRGTTLRQAAAVLARCSLSVANDTGLKHLAAAVGVPVVEINGYRAGGDPHHDHAPERFRAWGVPSRVVRPGSGAGLLAVEEVTVAAVTASCAELLQESARKGVRCCP